MITTRSLLVVDDDPDCLAFARAVLSPRYTVRTAGSADQCRSALKRRKPDLILLDVMMTNLCDGLELAKELKTGPATRTIPVIMLTNVNEVYDYRTQVEASYFPHDRWLDKPVKAADLLAAVAGALDEPAGVPAP